MRRAEIRAIGKIRDAGLRAVCDDYYRRSSSLLTVVERVFRDSKSLYQSFQRSDFVIGLDERGTGLTTVEFAKELEGWLGHTSSRLVFVLGGADGLSSEIRDRADYMISLSPLTFAHRLARVILAEQIYRVVSVINGSPYHRE